MLSVALLQNCQYISIQNAYFLTLYSNYFTLPEVKGFKKSKAEELFFLRSVQRLQIDFFLCAETLWYLRFHLGAHQVITKIKHAAFFFLSGRNKAVKWRQLFSLCAHFFLGLSGVVLTILLLPCYSFRKQKNKIKERKTKCNFYSLRLCFVLCAMMGSHPDSLSGKKR